MESWFFTDNVPALLGLMCVVVLAGIVRGAIGFGFSALVVAGGSLWLTPVHLITMVVLLEVVGSLLMLNSTRDAIYPALLIPLGLGTLLLLPVGVWVLARIDINAYQLLVSVYLLVVALLTLAAVKFRPQPGGLRLAVAGMIAGFYSGLSGVGGVFVAMFLNGSRVSGKDIRGTMSTYFLLTEAVFISSAVYTGILTWQVVMTAVLMLPAMFIGIRLGIRLFRQLPDLWLRRMVLVALVLLSLGGLAKVWWGSA